MADLFTREGFKTLTPLDGLSPFSAVGEPDEQLLHFAETGRTNVRVEADVSKDVESRMTKSGADYLVIDNSAALLWHREVNGRYYTVIPGEPTDFMDALWNDDVDRSSALAFKPAHGLTPSLRAAYAAFAEACLSSFDPSRIILIRSRAARFCVADNGEISPTNVNRASARLLEQLDVLFIELTGCLVSDASLSWVPKVPNWLAVDHELRTSIEADLVELVTGTRRAGGVGKIGVTGQGDTSLYESAADHVVNATRRERPIDADFLSSYFNTGGVSFDDLLALAFLEQSDDDGYEELVRKCVRQAVGDPDSELVGDTKRRFDSTLSRLRDWKWCIPKIPDKDPWEPQIALVCDKLVLRFRADGTIDTVRTSDVKEVDAQEIVVGRQSITPLNLTSALASWAMYFERGRRGICAAPRVVVQDAAALIDTCYWLDWKRSLTDECLVITTPHRDGVRQRRKPSARTDLSFIFDPNSRICTVGGGLMDQVTHIALFNQICSRFGFDYYLDDFRYTWWRSHNGFEASRLAPELEHKRMTRRVSQALIESFRREVRTSRLPWVFNQSRTWHVFGLREATVVTRDHFNSRRLMEIGPPFPVVMYQRRDDLAEYMRRPPNSLCFFTTQHRIEIAPENADAIRQVFSFTHLEQICRDQEIIETAEELRATPHVAFHVRRGDYLGPHFDTGGWHGRQDHYRTAIDYLISSELGSSNFDVAVFSDDLEFVSRHMEEYGLDRVSGAIRFVRGNSHYKSIFDSYLMSLCPVVVGSVGFFAATTSLLADPPSTFIRARPGGTRVEWRR